MDPPPLPEPPRNHSIKEALSRKRNSLDQEIEQFKALKESEFKAYEEELKTQTEENQSTHTPPKENGTGPIVERGFKPNGIKSPSTTNESTKPFGEQRSSVNNTALSQQLSHAEQDHTKSSILSSTEQGSEKGEPKMELRSLFPSFLPLLENPSNQQITSPSTYSHRRSLSALSNFSSSLTTLPSTTCGGHSPVQSSSAPRPSISMRRSSSSPTGGSLRSSLRQPKSPEQGPRETKHVLFSIDNEVMSPSSSPVLRRGEPGRKGKKKSIVATSARKGASLANPRSQEPSEDDQIPNISIAQPRTASPAPHARSYQDLIEPTLTSPPATLEAEDFGTESSDPLFDFEDEEAKDAVAPTEDDEGDLRQKRRGKTRDREGDSEGLAVSPHAGSLPIEIRWPVRRA